MVAESECKDQILLLNQVSSGVVGEIFRSSKFSLWNGVSIGLYHSLSSGCPAVIWSKRGSAEHLIKHKLNGFWYDEYVQIPAVLEEVATHSWDRELIKESVKHANSPTYFQAALDLVCAKNFQSANK